MGGPTWGTTHVLPYHLAIYALSTVAWSRVWGCVHLLISHPVCHSFVRRLVAAPAHHHQTCALLYCPPSYGVFARVVLAYHTTACLMLRRSLSGQS